MWRCQVKQAIHLRHRWWDWPVTAPQGQDLWPSSTRAAMRQACTRDSFHGCELRREADFAVLHRRMRRSVRTRLLRDKTYRGRAETSSSRQDVLARCMRLVLQCGSHGARWRCELASRPGGARALRPADTAWSMISRKAGTPDAGDGGNDGRSPSRWLNDANSRAHPSRPR